MLKCGIGCRLRDCRQVVWQPDETQCISDLWRCGQVTNSSTCERERFGHGARDDEAFATFEQGESRTSPGKRKFLVRLIDHDHGIEFLAGFINGFDDVKAQRSTRG